MGKIFNRPNSGGSAFSVNVEETTAAEGVSITIQRDDAPNFLTAVLSATVDGVAAATPTAVDDNTAQLVIPSGVTLGTGKIVSFTADTFTATDTIEIVDAPSLPAADTILLLRAGSTADSYIDASNDARAISETGTVGDVSHNDTDQFFSGSDSILFTQTTTQTDDGAGLDVDKQTLGSTIFPASTEFFVECKIHIDTLPSGSDPFATGVIVSTFENSSRTFAFRVLSSGILQLLITNGTSLSSTTVLSIDTDYTVAVSRDSSNVIRMFVDGVQEPNTVTDSNAIGIDSWTVGYLEAAELTVPRTQLFQGSLDELVVVAGASVHTSNYTPETQRYVLV